MAEHISTGRVAQGMVREALEADEWFRLHRVRFVEQNSEELAELIQQRLEELEGPVCVIGVDSERNDAPAVEVDVSVTVTEVVPVNRSVQGFATALEVCEAIVDDLDGGDWHWNDDLRHEVPKEGGGLLTARTTFRALLQRGVDESGD